MKDCYYTVKGDGEAELVEKKSRFIAFVKKVECENEAVEFIDMLRKKHWSASHNVYAYILEKDNISRFSDDGEPSGTAGKPVLDVLKKEKLSNVAVVVTRHFGGTLLGTGGLVRAYGKAAKLGVDSAVIVCMRLCAEIVIECDYVMLGKIQNKIAEFEGITHDVVYSDNVKVTVFVMMDVAEKFKKDIIEAAFGRVKIETGENRYVANNI